MKRFCLLLLLSFAAHGQQQCPVDKLTAYTWGSEVADNYTHVDADQAKMTPEWVYLEGNVVAKRGQEVFYGEKIDYHRDKEHLNSDKTVIYGRPDFALQAADSDYSLKNAHGQFENVEYYLKKQKAVGQAKHIKINRQKQTEELDEATYTTCSRLNPNWFLKAKSLRLNHEKDIGVARHVTFRIADVPVMYLPYFSFPISDKRKTGFLIPRAGSSSSRGVQLSTPFYINIAANQDATITPILMSRRGVMLAAEYRYLLPYLEGTVAGTYLHKDSKTKNTRWSLKTLHNYQPNNKFRISALYQKVSDKNYIADLTDSLDLTTDKFLPSYLKATYRLNANYTLEAEAKTYQVVDNAYTDANKPYEILPRVSGVGHWSLGQGFTFSSESEAINFDKDNRVSGIRLDQKLALGYAFENSYSFIKPTLSYRYSAYQLRDQAAGVPKNINRSIPTFSLDSGLYFDRQTTWLGRSATQSLEPRLFYLYTPFEDQSKIPNFDTALIGSTYSSMFLDNRFSGKDRIGDANQITTAISTTYTDNDTGQELASFAIGQIQYFADRHVSLNNSIANASRSNVIAEARAQLTDTIKFRGLLHRDIDGNHTEKSIVGLTYSPRQNQNISLSHLYDRNNYKQIDFTGVWQFNDAWRAFWRWHYSVEHHKAIDTIAGVEYAECCWAVRLLARQQRDNLSKDEKPDNSIYLEFVLNGLGNLGNDAGGALKAVIPGYRPIGYERN